MSVTAEVNLQKVKKIILKDVEKIETGDGALFPIYRDWDEWHDGYVPKMSYVTTINPEVTKGPILHKKRRHYITALTGIIRLSCLIDGELQSYMLLDEEKQSRIALIPENTPITLENLSSSEVATVLNLPSRAWHPDDEDTYKFQNWEEVKKWDV